MYKRINVIMPTELHEDIVKAAAELGCTLPGFLLWSAQAYAKQKGIPFGYKIKPSEVKKQRGAGGTSRVQPVKPQDETKLRHILAQGPRTEKELCRFMGWGRTKFRAQIAKMGWVIKDTSVRPMLYRAKP